MLEGVQILAQDPIKDFGYGGYVLGACVIIALIASIVYAIKEFNFIEGCCLVFYGFAISFCIGVILAMPVSAITSSPTGKYTYKVTVDENVSIVDFYERYEVISQDGMIFTVREKDGNYD